MNSETAEHLTKLLKMSSPIERMSEREWSHPYLSWEYIKNLILPIQKKYEKAAQEKEIRLAAKEKREAYSYYDGIGHKSPHSVEWHPYCGFSLILLEMCSDEIDVAIKTDNDNRMAQYEAYRLACEQGVAVPPNS